MTRDNTYGNKMWTPEYEAEMKKQQLMQEELNELEEIPDVNDNIRYYKPQAMGFTQADP